MFHSNRLRARIQRAGGRDGSEGGGSEVGQKRCWRPQGGQWEKVYTPEFLAELEAIDKRVREEGAKCIRRSVERLIAMGFYDKDGNRLKKELPADMLPGADRDFGG
jgi:hypothetical protein